MKKGKEYNNIIFFAEVVQEAIELINDFTKEEHGSITREIEFTNEDWSYDNDEDFFADFRKGFNCASYYMDSYRTGFGISFESFHRGYFPPSTSITINAPKRWQIEDMFEVFERNVDKCRLPPPPKPPEEPKPKPVIFIGHGGSGQWRDLKDHLQDKHDYSIEAYEIGARTGHAIRDILEEMLDKSSFAILIMTGEDEVKNGEMRARQNVVHELGLFQGRLGFTKAIALLEDGTEEFSNIHGVNQIRYSKGNIKETFGEVLATLRREFGDS